MGEYVTDTHALDWHLAHDSALSPTTRRIFEAADEGQHRIHVAGITLIEMVYLGE
jgi:PIN domain nuclease of toxin-antitoxin system